MIITDLHNIDFDTLFAAFQRAFADYAVTFDRDEVRRMLRRRGFRPELSFGAFDNNELVAFTFNGIGMHNGIMTAYDTGTGTARGYRGKGLARAIFRHSIPFLKKAGVRQYLLEVLQGNAGAISVYQKLGFGKTREFRCFRQQKDAVTVHAEVGPGPHVTIKETDAVAIAAASAFTDFIPSWQNSIASIQRAGNDLLCLEALIGDEPAGYIVADTHTGDLTQIAVAPGHRRRGIATLLLDEALRRMHADSVKVLNVCSTDYSLPAFLAAKNIAPASGQFEMLLPLVD